jgi:ABC-type multidrug transport system ATPase subunit
MSSSAAPLTFHDLRKSYGSKEILSGFDGTFAPGRLGALVGPNGAGKTTLLRIAAALQFASSGSVSGEEVLYYGGFDTLPIHGTTADFRRALGLPTGSDGRRPLRTLSRGQLHSVGLEAALDLARHTILLDEPWTALEPDARENLNDRLTRMKSVGHVIVCSTHDLGEVARIADDVVLLKSGSAVWRRREDEPHVQFDRDAILELYRRGA